MLVSGKQSQAPGQRPDFMGLTMPGKAWSQVRCRAKDRDPAMDHPPLLDCCILQLSTAVRLHSPLNRHRHRDRLMRHLHAFDSMSAPGIQTPSVNQADSSIFRVSKPSIPA